MQKRKEKGKQRKGGNRKQKNMTLETVYWATANATTDASECESETLSVLLPAAIKASPDSFTCKDTVSQ